MSEQAAEQPTVAPEAAEPAEQAHEEPFDADRAQAKIRKANSEAENLRKRLKELEPLAQKAQELEDAKRSDVEKLTEKNAKAEQRAQAAEAELTRVRIAMRHGISEDDFDLLGSGSDEQIEARAKRIAEMKAAAGIPAAQVAARRPVEQLQPGASPVQQTPDDDSYPDAWLSPTQRARLSGGAT